MRGTLVLETQEAGIGRNHWVASLLPSEKHDVDLMGLEPDSTPLIHSFDCFLALFDYALAEITWR